MEADYESKESSLRRIGSDSFDSYTGCGCVCRGDGRAGADGKYTSTVCTGAENQEKAASYAEKIDTNEISNWPQGPAIYAASGIVMDMNSGAVLYAKKAEEKRYPASITKVLSVLTALQYAKMFRYRCVSEDSISFCSGMMRRSDEARGRNQHGVSTLWDASGFGK